ncbi:hypothetical protein AAG570_006559 [Ranatra chinensis]|uniref:Integrase zinc-binding domain-containing protein n=1 Tax=Ranatra chinensis TaxID=642074 RepID=A0ABD0YUF0_9HEMI
MHDADCKKTAFQFIKGKYEFTRVPFGLKNAPMAFHRSLRDHGKHLTQLLRRQKEFGLKASREKLRTYQTFRPSVKFMGYVTSTDWIHLDPGKGSSLIEITNRLPAIQNDYEQRQRVAHLWRKYYWPSMARMVGEELAKCIMCQAKYVWTPEETLQSTLQEHLHLLGSGRSGEEEWARAVLAYYSSLHSATGMTPLESMRIWQHRDDPPVSVERECEELVERVDREKRDHVKRAHDKTIDCWDQLHAGDLMIVCNWYKGQKTDPQFVGSFVVVRKMSAESCDVLLYCCLKSGGGTAPPPRALDRGGARAQWRPPPSRPRGPCLQHPGLNSAEGGIGGWESLPSPNDPGIDGRAVVPTSADGSTPRRRDRGCSTPPGRPGRRCTGTRGSESLRLDPNLLAPAWTCRAILEGKGLLFYRQSPHERRTQIASEDASHIGELRTAK